MTVLPSVTWPSPPTATRPSRRTQRIVVPWGSKEDKAIGDSGQGVVRRRSRDGIRSGALVAVLDEFSTPFPGFYLYYPQRRLASAALRELVDYLRRARRR